MKKKLVYFFKVYYILIIFCVYVEGIYLLLGWRMKRELVLGIGLIFLGMWSFDIFFGWVVDGVWDFFLFFLFFMFFLLILFLIVVFIKWGFIELEFYYLNESR